MNGKMAKMLRKMGRADAPSKKLFKTLDQHTKRKVRKLFKDNGKVAGLDQLVVVTGVPKRDLSVNVE